MGWGKGEGGVEERVRNNAGFTVTVIEQYFFVEPETSMCIPRRLANMPDFIESVGADQTSRLGRYVVW